MENFFIGFALCAYIALAIPFYRNAKRQFDRQPDDGLAPLWTFLSLWPISILICGLMIVIFDAAPRGFTHIQSN